MKLPIFFQKVDKSSHFCYFFISSQEEQIDYKNGENSSFSDKID